MNKQENISEFTRLMSCGHGRCAVMLEDNREMYQEAVLQGCLNDLSFDMQCEGSRGIFMYRLAMKYDDPEYFLGAVCEKLLDSRVNNDWHMICHLTDIVFCFADDGNEAARNTLEKKYSELYSLIMSLRYSCKAARICECFEYTAIRLMQCSDFCRLREIMLDIGAYFIRRRRTPDNELRWSFLWFYSSAAERFGETDIRNILIDSPQIKRFFRVMDTDPFVETVGDNAEAVTAEDIADGDISPRERRRFVFKASEEERIRLAEAAVRETDLSKKAELLRMFSSKYNPFPSEPQLLTAYAGSENKELSRAAKDALMYVKSDIVHSYAVDILRSSDDTDALHMLISNYRKDDLAVITDKLGRLETDRNDESGWHGLMMTILDEADNGSIPDELLLYIYERSLCSCCRSSAVRILAERRSLTSGQAHECLYDCNEDTRNAARQYIDNLPENC